MWASVERALEGYVRMQRRRADWVQEQSRGGGAGLGPAVRRPLRSCASEETRCFATAIDRSFRRRSRFRIQTLLWEGLPAMNGVRKR
jgi:hypothetical protein